MSIIRILKTTLFTCFLLLPSMLQAIPQIQQATLDNGVKVLLIESHNIPMVAMQLSMPAGSRFETNDKAGTASLLAAMLADHTAKHNDKAWATWLDSEAIQLGANADRDTMKISLTTLKSSFATGLDALTEMLLKPGWNTQRFAILHKDSISGAIKNQEEPGVRTADATASLLYGEHAYGHRPSGTAKTLANIQLADLQKLYKAQIKPVGSVISISGDITMQEALTLLQPRLAKWQGKPKIAALSIAMPIPVHGKQQHISMTTSQMLVQFSRQGVSRLEQDFFPLFVMNHMLGGGGFGSRLMEEVREKRGLVYGVYSYFMPLLSPGPFVITLQTKASQAEDAKAVVLEVMRKMQQGNISKKQLMDSKNYLIGGFAQRMDSNRERVGLMSMIGFYGLPLDYLQRWTKNVNSVTLDNVKRVAHHWLNPDDWNLVETGPNPS